MTSYSDPVHLPIYTPCDTPPSIARGDVEQGYRMLREFYSPYKRLVLPEVNDFTAGADHAICARTEPTELARENVTAAQAHDRAVSGGRKDVFSSVAVGQAKRRMAGEQK